MMTIPIYQVDAFTLGSFSGNPVAVSEALCDALGAAPSEVHLSRDILAVLDDEASVRFLSPDQAKLLALDDGLGVIVSAKGETVDFVSRFFVPKAGVAEGPVTGSAHCTLFLTGSIHLWRG